MVDYSALHFTLHFDGACGPVNPGGIGSYGYVLELGDAILAADSRAFDSGPHVSNNLAEFTGLGAGLTAFQRVYEEVRPDQKASRRWHFQVYGDSKLAINIMNRKWKADPASLYYPAVHGCFVELNRIRKLWVTVGFDWIPREQNKAADQLSKIARVNNTWKHSRYVENSVENYDISGLADKKIAKGLSLIDWK